MHRARPPLSLVRNGDRQAAPARTPVRVAVVVERRYLAQAQPAGLVTALREAGHRVHVVDPLADAHRLGEPRWLEDTDLVVARGRSWELLCLLAWAEARGIPCVNTRAAIGAVHNKAEMAVTLEAAGVPTPATYLGAVTMLGAAVQRSGSRFPLVLKPLFGDNARGLRLVRDARELATLAWPEPVALAQEWLPSDGYDRKLYGIGDAVWAVRKRSPLAAATAHAQASAPAPMAEPLRVTPADRALAVRCRRAFGLELYGIDCIQTPRGARVIEVNDYPNYTGVAGASDKLAAHVLRLCRNGKRRR